MAQSAVGPVTLDEATGSRLFRSGLRAWHRDQPALLKQADGLVGIGFHSPERLEACLLSRPGAEGWEILAAGFTPSDLGRLGLSVLVADLAMRAGDLPILLSRVAPEEIDSSLLVELGFHPGREHLLFATEAQAA